LRNRHAILSRESRAGPNAEANNLGTVSQNVRHRYTLSKLHAHAGAHSTESCIKDCTGERADAPAVGAWRTVTVHCLAGYLLTALAGRCRTEEGVPRKQTNQGKPHAAGKKTNIKPPAPAPAPSSGEHKE
jgi:hypothetical protein